MLRNILAILCLFIFTSNYLHAQETTDCKEISSKIKNNDKDSVYRKLSTSIFYHRLEKTKEMWTCLSEEIKSEFAKRPANIRFDGEPLNNHTLLEVSVRNTSLELKNSKIDFVDDPYIVNELCKYNPDQFNVRGDFNSNITPEWYRENLGPQFLALFGNTFYGRTPLQLALAGDRVFLNKAEAILNCGGSINQKDPVSGATPAMLLALYGAWDILNSFKAEVEDYKAVDANKDTILKYAEDGLFQRKLRDGLSYAPALLETEMLAFLREKTEGLKTTRSCLGFSDFTYVAPQSLELHQDFILKIVNKYGRENWTTELKRLHPSILIAKEAPDFVNEIVDEKKSVLIDKLIKKCRTFGFESCALLDSNVSSDLKTRTGDKEVQIYIEYKINVDVLGKKNENTICK